MRLHRAEAIGAVVLAGAMIAAACGSSSSSKTATGTIASQLVLGGPPECQTRITCLIGLQTIYGLHFKSFKQLDEVGPISEQALATNQVQVVRLDSSDPLILQDHWVILTDPKSFQQAGNIIPIIRTVKDNPQVSSLLDKVSTTMTQSDLLMLDSEVTLSHGTPRMSPPSTSSPRAWPPPRRRPPRRRSRSARPPSPRTRSWRTSTPTCSRAPATPSTRSSTWAAGRSTSRPWRAVPST